MTGTMTATTNKWGSRSSRSNRAVPSADNNAEEGDGVGCKAVDEGEAGDPRVVGLILRLCVLPRVLHLFRGHYARSLTNLASEFDDMLRVAAARLWRTTPNWSPTVEMQVQLPLRWRGMGFRPMREVAPAAYLGSWALVLPTVQNLVGGAPILGAAAAPSTTAMVVAQAEGDWRIHTSQPREDPVEWAAVAASSSGVPRQQRILSQALDHARRRRLKASAPPVDWTRIQNCAGVWAATWLAVTPTEHGLSFLDAEYAVLVHFRIRVPLQPERGICALLGRRPPGSGSTVRWSTWYDAEGDHVHACPLNAGSRFRRHDRVRDEIRRQLQWLGFDAVTEQEVPRPFPGPTSAHAASPSWRHT